MTSPRANNGTRHTFAFAAQLTDGMSKVLGEAVPVERLSAGQAGDREGMLEPGTGIKVESFDYIVILSEVLSTVHMRECTSTVQDQCIAQCNTNAMPSR